MIPDPLHTHLVTSDGRRIYRHPDDDLGVFRVPAGVTVVGWREERFGSLQAQTFGQEGTYALSFSLGFS